MLDKYFHSLFGFKDWFREPPAKYTPTEDPYPTIRHPHRLIDMQPGGRRFRHNVEMIRRVTKNYYRGFVFCSPAPKVGDGIRLDPYSVIVITEVEWMRNVDDMYRFVGRHAKITYDDSYGRKYAYDRSEYRWAHEEGGGDGLPQDYNS